MKKEPGWGMSHCWLLAAPMKPAPPSQLRGSDSCQLGPLQHCFGFGSRGFTLQAQNKQASAPAWGMERGEKE